MKSAARLVDAASMSESATLLDEPKVETGEATASATTPEAADTGTPAGDPAPAPTPAATETDEQSIDALLNEATMLAESAETTEAAGTTVAVKDTQLSEGAEADAAAKAAEAGHPQEAAEVPQPATASAEEPAAPNAEQSETASETPAANPWADEVAQLENQWAQGKEGEAAAPSEQLTGETQAQETAPPPAETDSTETAPAQAKSRFHALASVARKALAGPVLVLVVLDKPFAKFGPGLKNFIGYMGIATTIVAAACWILAPKVRSMLE